MSSLPALLALLPSPRPAVTGWPRLRWPRPPAALGTGSKEEYEQLRSQIGFVTYSVQLSARVAAVESCACSASGALIKGSATARRPLQRRLIVINASTIVSVQKALVVMKLSDIFIESLMLRPFLSSLCLIVQVKFIEII